MKREGVCVLAARWRLGLLPAAELRSVAGELLDSGRLTPSLVALFALSKDAVPWEGPALFEEALVELGCSVRDEATSAETLSRWLAECVLSGVFAPADACALGARFYVRTGYTQDTFLDWYSLNEEYCSVGRDGRSYRGPTETWLDEAVRAAAREFIER